MTKRIGTIMVMDAVSSMNRDRVNFEDRIMSYARRNNRDFVFHARSVKGTTAPHCMDLLRRRGMDYKNFFSEMDICRGYVILGLAEENHAISRRWFEVTIHHIIDELLFIGVEPCLVSCRKKVSGERFEKVYGGNKEIYTRKGTPWNQDSCFALSDISRRRNIDLLKSDISCPRQWDTISVDSCQKLTYLIANDLDAFINQ